MDSPTKCISKQYATGGSSRVMWKGLTPHAFVFGGRYEQWIIRFRYDQRNLIAHILCFGPPFFILRLFILTWGLVRLTSKYPSAIFFRCNASLTAALELLGVPHANNIARMTGHYREFPWAFVYLVLILMTLFATDSIKGSWDVQMEVRCSIKGRTNLSGISMATSDCTYISRWKSILYRRSVHRREDVS